MASWTLHWLPRSRPKILDRTAIHRGRGRPSPGSCHVSRSDQAPVLVVQGRRLGRRARHSGTALRGRAVGRAAPRSRRSRSHTTSVPSAGPGGTSRASRSPTTMRHVGLEAAGINLGLAEMLGRPDIREPPRTGSSVRTSSPQARERPQRRCSTSPHRTRRAPGDAASSSSTGATPPSRVVNRWAPTRCAPSRTARSLRAQLETAKRVFG